jgi:hypothetical protein
VVGGEVAAEQAAGVPCVLVMHAIPRGESSPVSRPKAAMHGHACHASDEDGDTACHGIITSGRDGNIPRCAWGTAKRVRKDPSTPRGTVRDGWKKCGSKVVVGYRKRSEQKSRPKEGR